uniref:Chromo domain-containing protein n=1 Tax=Parastrongyloides trichosuri TaxID=131310 RepID=A0A0N4Z5Y1_PARTI
MDHSYYEDNSIYPVKEVIGKKYKDGEILYKVWWEGYSKKQATWEPVKNFLCYSPIVEFESGPRPRNNEGML